MAIHLDVQDVKFVINFDFPSTSEDYIHRIGRTGRNKNSGTSYAFFTRENVKQLDSLIAILREAGQNICPRLLELSERNSNSNRSGNYRKRRYDQEESRNGGNYYDNDYANKKSRNNWNGSYSTNNGMVKRDNGNSQVIAPVNAMVDRRSRWDSNASVNQPSYVGQNGISSEVSSNSHYAANYQQSAGPQSYSMSSGSSSSARPSYSNYQNPPPPLPSTYAAGATTYEKRY